MTHDQTPSITVYPGLDPNAPEPTWNSTHAFKPSSEHDQFRRNSVDTELADHNPE
jgi:hypothetical protein